MVSIDLFPNPRRIARRRRSAVALLVTLVLCAGALPTAQSQTNDKIEEAEDKISEAREEQLKAAMQLEIIEAEDEEVLAALAAATELVLLQEAKIEAAQQRLDLAVETRDQAELELEAIVSAIAEAQVRAQLVAVESYMDSNEGNVETWLDAETATDGAHRVALLEAVGVNTTDALDQLRAVEERRTDLVTVAEQAQAEADAVQEELADALVELEADRQRQAELKAEIDVRRTEWEGQLAEWEAEEERLEAFIVAEQARIQRELEERRRAAAAAAAANSAPVGVINASGWTWPTSGGVASGFGQRLHPILGYYRMHSGLDIGGAQGASIWAATEGVVISAGWNGGYGNTVIVQHANNTATLYAHMSGFAVSTGDYVLTGDVIGYVGSTGLSTGPHLHFEVRVNGAPVNPRPYLP